MRIVSSLQPKIMNGDFFTWTVAVVRNKRQEKNQASNLHLRIRSAIVFINSQSANQLVIRTLGLGLGLGLDLVGY